MSQSSGSSLSASSIALIALVDARARRLQQQVLFFEYLTPKLRGRQQWKQRLRYNFRYTKTQNHQFQDELLSSSIMGPPVYGPINLHFH